jgi:hypothetical protein
MLGRAAMAKYWSVSDEDAEFTKHLIRHFILAKKLGIAPHTSTADLAKLNGIWQGRDDDDVAQAEYKQIWMRVEDEIKETNNVR